MLTRYRPTWLEIKLENIYHNMTRVQERIGHKTVIPVVKANAYGHGAVPVTEYLRNKGVRFFAVSLLEEALELRDVYKDIDILIMGVVDPSDFDVIRQNDFVMTINDEDIAQAVLSYGKAIRCHFKFDSGMNRLGIKNMDFVVDFFTTVKTNSRVSLEGIYTHFATADGDKSFFEQQLKRFRDVMNALPYRPAFVHVSNSAASLKYEKTIPETTAVRVGLTLYGFDPEHKETMFKPTFILKSTIVQVKMLKKGEKVGYGITYEAQEAETIGIIPIGYADGLIRKNQGGFVDIAGQTYPLVGRVCMDYAFVKIDDNVKKGDTVTLMGGAVSVHDIAQRLETIAYEVLCTVTARVPRVYDDGE